MQHAIAIAHNIDEAMSNYHNTLSHARDSGGRSYAGRARGSAPNQMLLDFDRPAEAGINIYFNRMGLDLGNVPAAIDKLLAAQARLPLQTRRDQIQVEFQQFSTPPAEALVVVKAAALCPGMSVLEPSAGTGNIAVLARLVGAHVDTNEIDPRRRELLTLQGFEPTALDAERLDNLLPLEKRALRHLRG